MNGTIFNIQRFSLKDGPGIRTTVFLKGCNLRCGWCHNPEGLNSALSLQYIDGKCIGCRICENICMEGVHEFKEKHIVNFEKCNKCFKCVDSCNALALNKNGQIYTPIDLYNELIKDYEYFENGGITFSGGEPMLQADFIKEVAVLLKEKNIHIAIDTACNVDINEYYKLKDLVDLFLIDIKCIDNLLHLENTKVSNKLILENILKLDKLNIPIWIRIPLIGGFNDDELELLKIKDFISKLNNVKKVTLIPYHTLGYEKYDSLGIKCNMNNYHEIDDALFIKYENIFKL